MRTRFALVGLLFTIGTIGVSSVICPVAAALPETTGQARKEVLILYDEDNDLPGLALLNRSLRASFESELGSAVQFYSESLNLSQFEGPGYDRLVADHYRRKYSGKALDLIIAAMEPSLDFLLRHGEALFPGVPIVFCGVDGATIKDRQLRENVTGVLVRREFAPTLDVALRLQPRTRNVFVVGGSSTFDRHLQTLIRRDLQPFEGRVVISYLVGLPLASLLRAVSNLPPDSVILYLTVFSDGAGRSFVPHEVVSSIAAAASAPVYVFIDQFVGRGAIGGNVYSLETHGSQAAELGLRILRGATPASLPIRELGPQTNMFDARQLRRWKLDDTRLPSGSIVRHGNPSLWKLYRWYIVGTVAVVVLQSMLIAGLLLASARRRRAEAEARKQREALAHVLRVTTLGELTSSLAHEINQPLAAILTNAQAAHRLLDRGLDEIEDVRDALADIAADAQRASQVIQQLRTLFRKESTEPVAVDVNTLIANAVGLLRTDMLARRIDVRLLLGEVPLILGDSVLLEQVVLNVVVNGCEAIDATKEGPRAITIRTSQPRSGRLSLEVQDTGIGAKETDLERIFEPFVSSKPQGLGMGLAISRSIIKAHGGRIWATTNPDRGVTMHIDLPGGSETPLRRETDELRPPLPRHRGGSPLSTQSTSSV